MKEYLQKKTQNEIIKLFGTIEFDQEYDYKRQRNKTDKINISFVMTTTLQTLQKSNQYPIAFIITFFLYAALTGIIFFIPSNQADSKTISIEIVQPQKQKPVEVPLEPESKPEPKKQKKIEKKADPQKIVKKAEPKPIPVEPQVQEPIKSQEAVETEPVMPVFGLSANSFAQGNSGSAFHVRQGNTLLKEPEKEIVQAKPAKPYKIIEAAQVTKRPEVLKEYKIEYPKQAREAGLEGAVILEVEINENGKVQEVKIISGPSKELNEAAKKALFHYIFSPAMKDGNPVSTIIRYTYRFQLESE